MRHGVVATRYDGYADYVAPLPLSMARSLNSHSNTGSWKARHSVLAFGGIVRERIWFFQESILRTARVRVLVSDDGLTYAALYRVGPNGPVRVALDSLTEEGVFVRTAMPGAGIQESTADFHRTEVPWRSI